MLQVNIPNIAQFQLLNRDHLLLSLVLCQLFSSILREEITQAVAKILLVALALKKKTT